MLGLRKKEEEKGILVFDRTEEILPQWAKSPSSAHWLF